MHKGRSRKCLGFRSYSLPLEYLAKAIGISIPTVCRMKIEAKKAGMNKRRSRKCLGFRSYSMPLEYLAKTMGISIPTVCRMKAEAQKAGFIVVKHQLKKIEIEQSQFANFRKFTDDSQKMVVFYNKLFEQLPDQITPFVVAKKRCNLKQIKLKI